MGAETRDVQIIARILNGMNYFCILCFLLWTNLFLPNKFHRHLYQQEILNNWFNSNNLDVRMKSKVAFCFIENCRMHVTQI